ncbi:MAG: FtsK/SpoIIIE domain-containing protein [Planctomycetota bacterium]
MASEPLSTRRLLELMRDLQRCASDRQQEEDRVATFRSEGEAAARAAHDAAVERAEQRYAQRKEEAESKAAAERGRIESAYEAERSGAQQEYHGLRSAAESDRRRTSAEAQQRHKDEALVILSTFDAQKGQPRRRLEEFVAGLRRRREELTAIDRDARSILTARRLPLPAEPPEVEDPGDDGAAGDSDATVQAAAAAVATQVDAARAAAQAIYDQRLSRLLEAAPSTIAGFIGAAVGGVAVGLATGWATTPLWVGCFGGAAVASAGLWFGVRPMARKQAQGELEKLSLAQQRAAEAIDAAAKSAEARSRRQARELIARRDSDLAALGFEIEQLVGGVKARTGEQLKSAGEVFPARLAEMREDYEAKAAVVDESLTAQLGQITQERDHDIADAAATEREELQNVADEHQRQWQAMRESWLAAYEAIRADFNAVRSTCDARRLDFATGDYAAWEKPGDVAMGVEFGRAKLELATVKSGMPADERLRPEETTFEMPAMITLLEQPSLVITSEGEGRRRATQLMQAVMLRWITSQPPGKVRFAILDPVGLGEGFNSFMHLADYDEGLIATRIWSSGRDIEEQLARLTHHMETVIQKYLRSEYESIHEYNAHAGEVAEPLQVLVVNGFPNGFNDDTARRLISLATNGPRCGVYVVVSIDAQERLPTDFRLDDLLGSAVHLDWRTNAQRFVWNYPAFDKLPLELVSPPPAERMVELVKQIGRAAKDAVRVEVPFEVVAPPAGALWEESCGDELRVPIGRAGANRLQHVRLGKGTSQHLLVAGKTGSGKSTFLHALVTSAAMHYSPDEVEFYLVDFKKGVEFKSYATNRLPHARVVAIESEREFGLSVLQRLDEELSRRGELYRASGVQNLADYRAEHPGVSMPRILLVIDEFQELFVEDDKLAQDATLLMDRLVRQGRAFGMHVVLGTQTLAGAFSIARSTLGQIAVRVALECSEADAHLILSDERNTAARFLSRPGEAIYNDQNGLLSANELFQVVWLPDRQRTEQLRVVDEKRETTGSTVAPTVVFEGNAPADPAANKQLVELLAKTSVEEVAGVSTPPAAFLGDAVAIKPPTAVPFGRHGGSNLLIVGPDEQSALGMLTVGAISLAASDATARFVVLDASRAGDASTGVWNQVAGALGAETVVADPGGAANAIATLAAEVTRREEESDDTAPPVYLIVHNAGRFRDLRRSEDDFSFSIDSDKPPSPDKQLAEILKSGPGVGVHTLLWCDSYNAASRLFDRMALREFALRVVIQMSAADSSNLIDTPAASQLKPHRALFYSDETGETEKLRPYGPPSEAWLASLTPAGSDA